MFVVEYVLVLKYSGTGMNTASLLLCRTTKKVRALRFLGLSEGRLAVHALHVDVGWLSR